MSKTSFFHFFFFLFLNVSAQKYELGKVTVEELMQKSHPQDTAAVAAILFKKATTFFNYAGKKGFTSYTDVELKIKIYKKEGFNWADVEIPYYVGYETIGQENIDIMSAYTYNLENNKVSREKVTNQGKFSQNLNEYWSKKTVSFPSVKEGSIIEIRYKLKTENLSVLPEFQFQYTIPVNYAELQTEIPEFYIYKGMLSGFVQLSTDQKMKLKVDSFTGEYNRTLQITYKQIVTKYSANDIKPIIEEEFINNINNYYGKIQNELQTIRMPDEKPKQISKSWEDVAKSIFDDKDFGAELRKSDYYLTDLNLLVKDLTTEYEKIKAVFLYVQKRMNWNKKYGYYSKKGLDIAYKEKTGNVAEINLMLTAMLRKLGLDSNPVLISTRENGIAFFPNKTVFNYVISAVKIDGEMLLLDATEKYTDINFLPIRDLNWSGRSIEAYNVCNEIDLMPRKNSVDKTNILAEINSQGEIKGKIREQYFDYNALWFRSKFANVDKISCIEYIEKKYSGLEVSDYEVQNNNDISKPIIENYSFTYNNFVEIIGDKMYFSPLLHFTQTENPFKQESRLYPIDFVYPNQDKYSVSVQIPDGYIIESLPTSKALSLPDDLGNFKYNISNTGNQIQLMYSFDINASVIISELYEVVKAFYKEMISKQTEKIVLKKT